MKVSLTSIAARQSKSIRDGWSSILENYTSRISHYYPFDSELFDSERGFLDWLERQTGRTPAYVVLLDSRGLQLDSEEFAGRIGRLRDEGTQRIVFAIGPADGWSDGARKRANLLLSLGRMTLPHQLARVVLAEQVYRACTILAGHPYHSGH
ncbi:23S rRNA (pseudouridine(1915)-N(3))-methyltransferase RlmH [Granulicella sp. S190]|uniref:23S rRNA (pseudouridine(1915)-N(3))-methyltransferase RlmH n=1 Tax=Granulicella sp. S190 TaxID=1747226 RepID=UPI00131E9A42|nr:23S rRNA (pseudouridine(1915)-N(3))-methyltransferase RlmH [Granulicella sp. S190]